MNRSNESESGQETAAMEQVRELLVGAQLKDMETRFHRQEENLLRELADTKNNTKIKFESLENYIKGEITSLKNRLREEKSARDAALKSEHKDRMQSVEQLVKDLENIASTFERNLNSLAESMDETAEALRAHIFTERNSLDEKIDSKYSETLEIISKTSKQIRGDMVYRSSLSNMLMDVVVKLSTNLAPAPDGNGKEPVTFYPEAEEAQQENIAPENK